MEETTNAAAIKEYFESDGGRKVTMAEMKALSQDDRKELGKLAATQLGKRIKEV